jgi:pimeloyl-ACP methyl ester carboxylesterase
MKLSRKRIAIGLGCFVTVLLVSGTIFETVIRQQIAKKYPVVGKLVDIGGRNIQIDCRGSGSPTVVLESGLGYSGSLSWAAVHNPIAETTRVCAYSRAGTMWSDPSTASDSKSITQDLHAALTKAGEKTPWVMVGHSLGGPYIMMFTNLYDKEVSGMVLVDATHPNQNDEARKIFGSSADPTWLEKIPPFVADATARVGIVRLLNICSPNRHIQPTMQQTICAYLPQNVGANLQETQSVESNLNAAKHLKKLGNRPLVVLTAISKINSDQFKKEDFEKEKQWQAIKQTLHKDEASWSSNSRHQIVDSSHSMQFDQPDVVVNAVREVVNDVRKTQVTAKP